MQKDITKELKKLLVNNSRKCINEDQITEKTLLVEDLQYDSLDFINLIVQIEERYNIDFNNSEGLIKNLNCFGNLKEYVMKHSKEV